MKELVVVLIIFGILFLIGKKLNPDGHEDHRFGKLTNIFYGVFAVLVFSVIARIFSLIIN